MSKFDIKMTELADSIKLKNPTADSRLSVQGMIDAVNGITISESSEFGYVTSDGKFQKVDITGSAPVDVGNAETIESVYVFATGQNEPDYATTIDTTATADDIVVGATAVLDGVLVTGNMPESSINVTGNVVNISAGYIKKQEEVVVGTAVEASEYIPGDTDIVIPAGSFLTGDQVIKAISDIGSADIEYGIMTDAGEFQALDLTGEPTIKGDSEAFGSLDMYHTGVEEPKYTSTGACLKFYECSSVNMSRAMNSNTWSGYLMTYNGESWETEYKLVDGLKYSSMVPEVGYIYSEDATIKIGTMLQNLSGVILEFTEPEYSNLGGTYKKKEDIVDFVLEDEDTGNTITTTGGNYYISGSEVSAPVGEGGPSVEDVARAKWVDRNGNYPSSRSKKLYYDPPTEEESSSSSSINIPVGAGNVVIIADILDYTKPHTLTMYPRYPNATDDSRAWAGESDYGLFDITGNPDGTWVFQTSAGAVLWTEGPPADPWNAAWTGGDTGWITVIRMTAVPIEQ